MNERSVDAGRIDWDKNHGLVPAIVQDVDSGGVLMLGYMNREALATTLARGRVVFYSRTRQRLWEKGETSGNHLEVAGIRLDCDADTLLVLARPAGPVCHTGDRSCFGDEPPTRAEPLAFLGRLEDIISARLDEAPEGSYTARLHARGVRRVAQKVGEEGLEVALAGAGEADPQLIAESADLLFHLLLLLRSRAIPLTAVVEELRQRHAARGSPDAE
ncbi:MAG: bifunctional phosphoribosyl-AMP cyclohydrolase/phosphoribosyl-ATP diphosphatase HisIE [Gammaproteobacteria bacterium]|nr:bifunctional phosphoribosyl-AMP cyclohydrolase/phosphoribosyl-ATP diphosphatase HisIE [Gammaproteobacteria bacterium]